MSLPEKASFPENKLRRHVLKAIGLLPVAMMLGGDRRPEYYEVMNSVEPHVHIEKTEVNAPVDLIGSGIWGMEGAAVQNGALLLEPIDLHIVNKRQGNRYDSLPPVNMYGVHLQSPGQFGLDMQVTHSPDAAFLLRLYAGEPPFRFDDFRFLQNPEIECRLTAHALVASMRQGDQTDAQELCRFPVPFANKRRLQVQRAADGALQFMVDGQTIGSTSTGILKGQQIWLGLGSKHSTAKLTDLIVRPRGGDKLTLVHTNTLEITQPSPSGLQTLIDKDKLAIGTGASLSHMMADERYAQLVLGSEFGRITPENGMKPQDVQPREGTFIFAEADALVDLTLRHGIQVHGHALMYDKAMPRWMRDLPHKTETDKQRLREVLWTHIHTVASHFKGRVASWDVWNELVSGFNDDVTLSENPFTRGLGEEAIDIGFRAARAADPEAKLFINDFGLETNPQGRGVFMLDLLTRAKLRGVPVDGLGIQGHVYELPRDAINPLVLTQIMATVGAIGLEVRVTELDITAQKGSATQAKQFADVAKVCAKAPNCTGYTVWGPTDAFGSTISVQGGKLVPGNALLYDANFRPKLARQAVAEVLRAVK